MRVLHNVSFIALLASGCSDPTDGSLTGQELYPGNPSGARWYSSEQVASGSQIFEMNCAECHGATGHVPHAATGHLPNGATGHIPHGVNGDFLMAQLSIFAMAHLSDAQWSDGI